MSDDFVGNPVKDVKNEEGEGEGRSRHRVNPLGPVHKLLLYVIRVPLGGWHLCSIGCRTFDGVSILHLQAGAHGVPREVQTPLSHVIILES